MSDILEIDVANWDVDPEHPVYPEGARPKRAYFPPQEWGVRGIDCNRRCLFKWAKKGYPQDQFWAEILAYWVGEMLDVDVPTTHIAWDSGQQRSGALIEWFYLDGEAEFVPAGDIFKRLIPGFDNKTGRQHNLTDLVALCLYFQRSERFEFLTAWQECWAKILAYDALIGNTDRHQGNWGFLLTTSPEGRRKVALAPAFDNGTALGQELLIDKVERWDAARFERYIDAGCHHLRLNRDSEKRLLLGEGVAKFLQWFPDEKNTVKAMLSKFDRDRLSFVLDNLQLATIPHPLADERRELMVRLLDARLTRLWNIVE